MLLILALLSDILLLRGRVTMLNAIDGHCMGEVSGVACGERKKNRSNSEGEGKQKILRNFAL